MDRHPERCFWNPSLVKAWDPKGYDSGSHFFVSTEPFKNNEILSRIKYGMTAVEEVDAIN